MKSKKICFLVGSMAISGGTYVIVQHAAYLKHKGYNITLAVQESFTEETLAWHDQTKELRCVPFDSAMKESFDLVIATWWKTALELHKFNSPRYGYFVQSIESRFYPEDEKPLRELVEATYNLDVSYITEAKWIKNYLKDKYGKLADIVPNGIRKDIYKLDGPAISDRDTERPRVLIEGPFGVPFKNTALAIRLAKRAGAKEIWVLTSSPVSSLPSVDKVFSRIPMFDTAAIYRSCDVLIKLSTVEGMFGPPLEMFHCGGTSVVFDVTGHDEYIVNGENSIVVATGNLNCVVKSIAEVLTDVDYRKRLTAGARKTAENWPDWKESSDSFCAWVENCLHGPVSDLSDLLQKINAAWLNYKHSENARLKSKPWVLRRHKVRAFVAKVFPVWMVKKIKIIECWIEIFRQDTKV